MPRTVIITENIPHDIVAGLHFITFVRPRGHSSSKTGSEIFNLPADFEQPEICQYVAKWPQ